MVIIKQELEISDVELDDDESQLNYDGNYLNYTDDDSYCNVQADIPEMKNTIIHSQSHIVYDRPKVFECYLCHKQWPTVGKTFFDIYFA